jgi:zinc transporter ZupT
MNAAELFIPFAAGIVGGLAGIYLHGRITKDVKVLLAFSGAYLFALAVMHLLPDIYMHLGTDAGLYILAGFLLQMIMEYFSKGVEHGHIHRSDQEAKIFPLGIFISLFLHSLIEGLPLSGGMGDAHAHHHHHGDHHDALLIGIAIHKIPEAIALSALLYHFFEKKGKVLLYLLIYSFATPIGMLLGYTLLSGTNNSAETLYAIILSVAVGIFLHVSTTIIFEAEDQHRFNWKKTTAILLGLGLVLAM